VIHKVKKKPIRKHKITFNQRTEKKIRVTGGLERQFILETTKKVRCKKERGAKSGNSD